VRRITVIDARTIVVWDPSLPSDVDEVVRLFWRQRGF
jgi:hypothetical protein